MVRVIAKLGLIPPVPFLLAVTIMACGIKPATDPVTSTPTNPVISPTISAPSAVSVPPAVPTPPNGSSSPSPEQSIGPVLSTSLKRECPPDNVRGGFENTGLSVGEMAVDFTLRDIHGTEFMLSRLLAEKPVMMLLGSFT